MSWQDAVNAAFELCGGIFIWLNVWAIWRDKQVKGVVWQTTAFWSGWGWWNLYYYPHLGQWLSFVGGVVLVIGNTAWLAFAFYYCWWLSPPRVMRRELRR